MGRDLFWNLLGCAPTPPFRQVFLRCAIGREEKRALCTPAANGRYVQLTMRWKLRPSLSALVKTMLPNNVCPHEALRLPRNHLSMRCADSSAISAACCQSRVLQYTRERGHVVKEARIWLVQGAGSFNRTVKLGGERSIEEIPRLRVPMLPGVMRGKMSSLLLYFFPLFLVPSSWLHSAAMLCKLGAQCYWDAPFFYISRPTLGARYRRGFFGGPLHRRCSLADRDPWRRDCRCLRCRSARLRRSSSFFEK